MGFSTAAADALAKVDTNLFCCFDGWRRLGDTVVMSSGTGSVRRSKDRCQHVRVGVDLAHGGL